MTHALGAPQGADVRLVARSALMVFLPLFLLISGLAGAIYYFQAGTRTVLLKGKGRQHVEHLEGHTTADLRAAASDLMFLAHQQKMSKLFRDDGSVDSGMKKELLGDFLHLCTVSKLYDQIRLIDAGGMELLRVNFNSGRPNVVPDAELQHKGHRYYFTQAIDLGRGGVFVSPLDLNIENGQIEDPQKPMVRFATPVFDRQGSKRGILVLNYLAARILAHFARPRDSMACEAMLLNSEGYWLKGPEPADEWGFMFEDRKDRTFGHAHPVAWERIQPAEEGQIETVEGLFTFATVHPLTTRQVSDTGPTGGTGDGSTGVRSRNYYWKIVSRVPPSALYAGRTAWLRWGGLGLLLVGLVLGHSSWRLARARVGRHWAEKALRGRDAILEAVSFAAQQLLRTDDPGTAMTDVLARLGRATDVSRVYAFENHESSNGELLTSQRYEWVAPGIEAQMDSPDVQDFPWIAGGMGRWVDYLPQGEAIHGLVGDFPASEQEILGAQDIKSIAVVPVFVAQQWWGFLGFGDCVAEREWADPEVGALHVAAGVIGASVERQRTAEMLRHENAFRSAVIDKAAEGICVCHEIPDHPFVHFTVWNERMTGIAGYTMDEINRHGWYQTLYPDPEVQGRAIERMERMREGDDLASEEWTITRRDGEERVLLISTSIVGSHEAGAHVLAVMHDVTERKRAEEALRESEERFRSLFENAPLGYQSLNADGNFIEVNETWGKVLGYTKEEVLGRNFSEFIHPDFREHFKESFPRFKSMGYILGVEFEMIRKDGSEIIVSFDGKIGHEEDGSFRQTHCVLSDITERKRAEEALRRSQASLQTSLREWGATFNAMNDPVALVDSEEKIRRCNRAMALLVGREVDEVLGLVWCDLVYGDQKPEDGCPFAHARDTLRRHPQTSHVGDRWFQTVVDPVLDESGAFVGAVHVMSDITERKQAEGQQAATISRLRSVVTAADELIACADLDTIYRRAVELARHELGLERCGVLITDGDVLRLTYGTNLSGQTTDERAYQFAPTGDPWPELLRRLAPGRAPWIYREDRPLYEWDGEKMVGVGRGWIVLTPIRAQSGSDLLGVFCNDAAITGAPVDETVQQILSVYCSLLGNIIQRKQAVEALGRSERLYRGAIEAAGAVVYFRNHDINAFEFVSPGIETLTGYPPEEFTPELWDSLIREAVPQGDFSGLSEEEAKEAMASRERAVWQADYRIITRDGTERWLANAAIHIHDHQATRLASLGTFQDITERRQAEAELRQYAETQAVLLREVNHRVKNNLSAIISMLQKEQDQANAKGLTSYLPALHDLTGRVQGLSTVHRLLSASEWRPLNLGRLCEEVILGAIHGLPLAEVVQVDVSPTPVEVDSTQAHHLTMVINELATNTLKHALAGRASAEIRVTVERDGETVRICFRNDGPGYPAEMVEGDFSRASVGFDLIRGIVRKSLRGTVALANDNGAVTIISFRSAGQPNRAEA